MHQEDIPADEFRLQQCVNKAGIETLFLPGECKIKCVS